MAHIFTTHYHDLKRQLKTEIVVVATNAQITDKSNKWIALWDTGATNTVITQNIIDVLGLKPVAYCKTHTPAGIFETEQYYVDIMLPNNLVIENLLVSRGLASGWDVLVGMDIIGRGDLAVSNFDQKTTLSFRIPSLEKINFIQSKVES